MGETEAETVIKIKISRFSQALGPILIQNLGPTWERLILQARRIVTIVFLVKFYIGIYFQWENSKIIENGKKCTNLFMVFFF